MGRFVTSDAGHGDFDLALRMRQLFDFDNLHRNVPRSNGFEVFVFGDDPNRIVALGFARVFAFGSFVGECANLLARRTVALVAVVRVGVVTLGMNSAR